MMQGASNKTTCSFYSLSKWILPTILTIAKIYNVLVNLYSNRTKQAKKCSAKMMTPKNFNEATVVLSALNYLWALRICQQPKNKVTLFINWVYCISVLSLTIVIIMFIEFVQLYDEQPVQSNVPSYDTKRTMHLFLVVFYIMMITWIVVLSWFHSKDLLVFKKQISKADEKFDKLSSPFNYQSMFTRILINGSVWLFISFILSGMYLKLILKYRTGIIVPFAVVIYLYANTVGSIVLFDFKTSVLWLGVRFKQTSKLLSSIFVKEHRIEKDIDSISKLTENHQLEYFSSRSKIYPENRLSDFKYKPRSTKMMFQQIRLLHLELCCTAKRLSKVYNMQLLLYAVLSLLHLATSLYYMYIDIHSSVDSFKLKFNIVTVIAMDRAVNFIKLCVVSYDCEHTMKQACKIVEIVHEFSLYETDVELNEEILQFILQLSHSQLGQPGSNFFRLNFSFLRECVTLVATYLVIVIQFSLDTDTVDDSVTQNSTIH